MSIITQKPTALESFEKADEFEKNFYQSIRHLSENEIVNTVRSMQMPPGRAFKIRKINADKSQNDRSTRLERSLVILSNGTIFYTGKQEDVRHGVYRPSAPQGEFLGRGTNKLAFKVFDLNTEQYKAISIPLCKITAMIFLPSMKREDEMTSQIDSPHILPARYFSRITKNQKELGYLESEVCLGTLKQMLGRDPKFLAKHPKVLEQVAKALKACHRAGIAHLDARQENIFLLKRSDGGIEAKLADFGQAQKLEQDPFEFDNPLIEDESFLEALENDYRVSCRSRGPSTD